MNADENIQQAAAEQAPEASPAAPADDQDFLSGVKACDLSGEGTCDACQ